jgi:HAE1 family hydrophobic/amphiphilic exporter-1/multidrug efflux pump
VFGIIMVFLILAAQYEKWSLPLAVIMAVPFAMFGALAAVLIRGMPNDIYFQIGLVVLIGLAAKNAILIVEFAAQKQAEGMSVDAALEGGAAALPPHRDDLAGLHPRRAAAGHLDRRRRRRPPLDGHRRGRRDARRHLHRHHLHPLFFKWLSRGKAATRPATCPTTRTRR